MPFRFANAIKLLGAAENNCRAQLLRRDRNNLEKWADRNQMKTNQGKCWVLHMAQVGPHATAQAGPAQLGSSFAKNNLWVDYLDLYPQCPLAAVKAAASRALQESAEQDIHEHTGLSLVEDHRTARGLQQEVLKDLGRSVLGQWDNRASTAACKHTIGG